jgi:hypothetical protein
MPVAIEGEPRAFIIWGSKTEKNRIPEDFFFFLCFPEEFFTGTWFWRGCRNSGFWTPCI